MLTGKSHVIVSTTTGSSFFHSVALEPDKLAVGVALISSVGVVRLMKNSKWSCHLTLTAQSINDHQFASNLPGQLANMLLGLGRLWSKFFILTSFSYFAFLSAYFSLQCTYFSQACMLIVKHMVTWHQQLIFAWSVHSMWQFDVYLGSLRWSYLLTKLCSKLL